MVLNIKSFKDYESIIQNNNFLKELGVISNKINEISLKSKTEADVIFAFDSYFVPYLRSEMGKEIIFSREQTIDHETKGLRVSKKGRIDSRIGSLIIEFKHYSKFKTKKQKDDATDQISRYLRTLNELSSGQFVGLITDGIKAIKIIKDNENINVSSEIPFDKEALKFIAEAIVLSQQKALNSENLVNDFTSGNNSISKELMQILLESFRKNINGKSKMLFNEWTELFRLSHDDNSKQTIQEKNTWEVLVNQLKILNNMKYYFVFKLLMQY